MLVTAAVVDVVVELEQLLLLLLIVLDLFVDIELEMDVLITALRQFDGGNDAAVDADDDDEDVVFTFDVLFESLSVVDDDVFVLLYLPNDVE